MRLIDDKRLLELLVAEDQLETLKVSGVDNWSGYDYAMEEYRGMKDAE